MRARFEGSVSQMRHFLALSLWSRCAAGAVQLNRSAPNLTGHRRRRQPAVRLGDADRSENDGGVSARARRCRAARSGGLAGWPHGRGHQLQQAGRRTAEDAERDRAAERRHDQDDRSGRISRAARRALGRRHACRHHRRRQPGAAASSTSRPAQVERTFKTEPGRLAHARALDRSHAHLLLEHARRQRQRVRLQDRRRRSRTSRPARNAKASA